MTLKTAGTNANSSLSAFQVTVNDVIPADVATLNTQIRLDPNTLNAVNVGSIRMRVNQPYSRRGVLYIPGRGILQIRSNDWIIWDTTTGWPLLLSNDAATNGPWTHT